VVTGTIIVIIIKIKIIACGEYQRVRQLEILPVMAILCDIIHPPPESVRNSGGMKSQNFSCKQ
jgi:hypothetical protein